MILRKILIRLKILIVPIIIVLDKISNFAWYNYPFGNKPRASEKNYLELAEQAKQQNYPEVDSYERSKGISLDKQWLDYLALHTQVTIKKSKLCYAHGRLLYAALSDYLLKKSKELNKEKIFILETGTARGFSAICMAKALEDNKADGFILTFDLLPHSTKMFWNSISDNTNGAQTRAQLLSNWKNLCQKYILFHQGDTRLELRKIYLERVHFVFFDGAHTYDDVMFEFNQIKNKQSRGDIIIYDDYDFKKFPGIVKAVNEICKKNNYDKKLIRSSPERGYVVAIKN
jgi:predicted O-methyltransferase YrrM